MPDDVDMEPRILRFDPNRRLSTPDSDRPDNRPPISPFAIRVLDGRRVAHRRRMLDHLQRREAAS
jgi:hypothetical protein